MATATIAELPKKKQAGEEIKAVSTGEPARSSTLWTHSARA
jgi:hypothetical protein